MDISPRHSFLSDFGVTAKSLGLFSMAGLGACVSESLTGDWYELPVVTRRVQGELHDAVSRAVAKFAVGGRRAVKGH
jgi:hypothetical protein